MITAPQSFPLSPDDYLRLEETSPIKHEYINSEIYAMAGASDTHVTIAGNLLAILRSHVRGTNCRGEAGLWVLQFHTPKSATATFQLASIDFSSSLTDLYEDVTLESPSTPSSQT